jgi:hypothetical protein
VSTSTSAADHAGAAVLGQQLGGAGQRDDGHLRVDAALEALGRLAGQPVPAGGAGHARSAPSARPRAARRSCRPDLGGGAAHDRGQPDRAGVVGDQQVVGRQLPRGAVEGGQLLALARQPDGDRAR